MTVQSSILCPIDFSDASAGALRHAAAIAGHTGARLIVLTVTEPLLAEALDTGTGLVWTAEECTHDMEQFAERTFGPGSATLATLDYVVEIGKPAAEILRVARDRGCALIVISARGVTGIRKLFFGATTERVLRETVMPVLVTPPIDPGVVHLEDARQILHRIVVPVDLSPASLHHTQVACAVGEALGLPLVLVHVIEPVQSPLATRLHLSTVEADRRAVAEAGLAELMESMSPGCRAEALVAYGDPAEELAKVARDRQAGLVVMGIHGSPSLGPRLGLVTYRLLCLCPSLMLALPSHPVEPLSPGVSVPALVAALVAAAGR